MNEHVNLLNNTGGRNYTKLITRLRVLRFIAVSFLFLVGASSIMLFLMIAFSPLPNLRLEEERYIQTLNSVEYRQKMDKYFYINSRLADINTLLKSRPDLAKSYDLVSSTIGDTTSINFIDITNDTVTLSLANSNLLSLEESIAALSDEAKNNKSLKSLTLSSISYKGSDNTYEMIITILLG